MLVSNFVVGYDLINRHKSSRTIYSLQITNLEPIPITFGLETHIKSVFFYSGGTPQSDLVHLGRIFSNAVYKLDEGYYNYTSVDIEANGMKIVGISPYPRDSDLQGFVAGYVSLRVPVVRESTPPFDIVPQSEKPVGVLLTASHEDSHRGKVAEDQVSDITYSYSNPQLASGTAYNEIPPDTSLFVNPKFVSKYVHEMSSWTAMSKAISGALNLHEQDAAQALIDLLSQLGDDKAEIDALNKALQTLKSPVSVRLNGGDR